MYNVFLACLLVLLAPKTLRKRDKRRHAYRRCFLPKFHLPKQAIWIHGVSLGEVYAARPLIAAIKKEHPGIPIVLSSSTNTGMQAAESIKGLAASFLLPFDFSFLMRPLLRRLQPKTLLLIEGDYWKNLIYYTKKQNAKLFLVSGKMSLRSARRLAKVPFWGRTIFTKFDGIFVQNQEYEKRFLQAGAPKDCVEVTGNIKYCASLPKLSDEEVTRWKRRFGMKEKELVITIGSTHFPEELLLLEKLLLLWKTFPQIKVLLAPRHPERFEEVATLLREKKIPFAKYTKEKISTEKPLILIDTMGLLATCYAVSDAAIVGGSYVDNIGGHNVLEPNFSGTPVFYGPFMHGQKDLAHLVENAKSGKVLQEHELVPFFTEYFACPKEKHRMKNAATQLISSLDENLAGTIQRFTEYGAFVR
ncbi:MAG: glycosyltransferase N-terminal domain-containing protein [Chlamydiota bacterium]